MEFLFAALGVAVAVAMILGARRRSRRAPPPAADAPPPAADRHPTARDGDGR